MILKIFTRLLGHKFVAGILFIAILGGVYFGYVKIFRNDESVRYATAQVRKGTLIVSVTGNGQVSALNLTDIKPETSGKIVWVGVKTNQSVRGGQALFRLDDTDIQAQIADAEYALEEEKSNYKDVAANARRAIADAYENGYNSVSTSFFKLAGYMTDLNDTAGSDDKYISVYKLILGSNSPLVENFQNNYSVARDVYNKKFALFQNTPKNSDRDTIYRLISETTEAANAITSALESARHMFDAIGLVDYSYLNTSSYLNAMRPKIEGDVSSAYATANSLKQLITAIDDANENAPKNIASAERSLNSKTDTWEKLKNALQDYTVYAPYAGTIAKVIAIESDSVSANTALATLITEQKIAEIILNEIDVTNVKNGQRATLMFDAVPELTLTGKVIGVDTLGTVSQGIVSYAVTIGIDTKDDRIKTAMSVSAAIVTDARQNILLAPNSAVKSNSGISYAEVVRDNDKNIALASGESGATLNAAPENRPIEIGVSNDEFTEIKNGLQEGDIVVIRTIAQNAVRTQTSQQQNSSFRIPGLNTGGGGGIFRETGR